MLRVFRAPRHVRLFLFILVVISAGAAHGQTTTFTYQGQLSDAGALANGSYDLSFALFDTAAGGAQIGANQSVPAVPVKAGVFTVQLDFGVNAFPGANRFVEIGVRPAGGGSFTTSGAAAADQLVALRDPYPQCGDGRCAVERVCRLRHECPDPGRRRQ